MHWVWEKYRLAGIGTGSVAAHLYGIKSDEEAQGATSAIHYRMFQLRQVILP